MIIYNVTINVDESIHDEWMNWMIENHIPKVLSTGKFFKALMTRVMVQEDLGPIRSSIPAPPESFWKIITGKMRVDCRKKHQNFLEIN